MFSISWIRESEQRDRWGVFTSSHKVNAEENHKLKKICIPVNTLQRLWWIDLLQEERWTQLCNIFDGTCNLAQLNYVERGRWVSTEINFAEQQNRVSPLIPTKTWERKAFHYRRVTTWCEWSPQTSFISESRAWPLLRWIPLVSGIFSREDNGFHTSLNEQLNESSLLLDITEMEIKW